ncbi:unnamed protein product [Chondrus crispus]|uniref:Uncharacterized protein n=1 Tax=Chondrus crispus TaxID=2769 RepID=R7QBK4_CHOCR|nr:unnamed protein product [Chondrus crispus]CDF34845.1 unnamed protein product [Chondrus crispus]|eukprot:XP_005714664.1 unnamed protein product [Chondrus crispus]
MPTRRNDPVFKNNSLLSVRLALCRTKSLCPASCTHVHARFLPADNIGDVVSLILKVVPFIMLESFRDRTIIPRGV